VASPIQPPPLPPPPSGETLTAPGFEAELAHVWAGLERVPREVLDSVRLKRAAESLGRTVSYTADEETIRNLPIILIQCMRDKKWAREGFPGLDPKRLDITLSTKTHRSPSGSNQAWSGSLSISWWLAGGTAVAAISSLASLALHIYRFAHGGAW